MRNRRYTILGLGLTLLLVGIVSACEVTPTKPPPLTPTPPAPTQEPTVSPAEIGKIQDECEEQGRAGRKKQDEYNPEGLEYPPFKDLLYVNDQLVVGGSPAEINKTLQVLGLKLSLVGDEQVALNDQQVIQLYEIADDRLLKGGAAVERATCEINKLRETRSEFTAFADPNYHVSPAGGWTGGGSPWTQNGDWARPGGGLGKAQGADFVTQWAFKAAGVGLFDTNGDRLIASMGEGVRIGIFDTSPFAEIDPEGRREFPWQELMKDVPEELTGKELPPLVVEHIQPIPAPTCPGLDRKTGADREGQDLSNHGLFVAGLAHAVAPASEIYLVRVLEDDACGSLYTIEKGLRTFMNEMKDKDGKLADTVINLSLGVHEPLDPTEFGLPEEVASLKAILQEAVEKGAVVVAAAGNDAYDDPADVSRVMEIPAGFSFVIGVAASDAERQRGCFSNAGDVAAPGGDGEPGQQAACEIPDCTASSGLCLISLALNSRTGYAYWVGTSFAAPLVSGQVALLLEAAQLPQANVVGAVRGTTCPSPDPTLPHGIINLPHALLGTSCP